MTRWSLFLQTLSLLHHFLGLYCLIESDDGVLAFLQGMIAQKSSSVGKYASRMGWYLPIDSVSEFIDPAVLVKPLERIKSERWADMTDLQREATDAFFAVWSTPPEERFNP